MTRKLAPNLGPMVGGRHTTTPVSSRSAGQQLTKKSYENRYLFARKQQQTYNFSKAGNRPTPAVCYAITSTSKAMQQCAVPSQVHGRPYIAFEGSAQLTPGDVGCDDEAQGWFLPREVDPE